MSAGDTAGPPQGMTGRVILHLDADCFYAQVEHRRLKIPTDVPLAVQQWTGLIAVNYAARAKGVSRHMNIDDAKKACPDLQLVHVELIGEKGGDPHAADKATDKVTLRRYREASGEIFHCLQRFGTVEKASIDEAYLDVTKEVEEVLREAQASHEEGEGSDMEAARLLSFAPEASCSNVYGELDLSSEADLRLAAGARICARVREAVKRDTQFTLSAGVSHNKMCAKLASAQNKPNKQTIVPASGVQSLMLTLPLTNIRGLGGKLGAQVLKELFPTNSDKGEALHASDLQCFSEADLSRIFGLQTATWLFRVCRGRDDEPVKENDKGKSINAFKSFSRIKSAGEETDRWLRVLSAELAERIHAEKKENSRTPRTLQLQFRGSGHGSRSMPLTSVATAAGVTESACAALLFDQAKTLLGRAGADAFPCTRLALSASDFRESVSGAGSIKHFFAATSQPNSSLSLECASQGSSPHADALDVGQAASSSGRSPSRQAPVFTPHTTQKQRSNNKGSMWKFVHTTQQSSAAHTHQAHQDTNTSEGATSHGGVASPAVAGGDVSHVLPHAGGQSSGSGAKHVKSVHSHEKDWSRAIKSLTDMGFAEQDAAVALDAAHGDVARTVEALLGGGASQAVSERGTVGGSALREMQTVGAAALGKGRKRPAGSRPAGQGSIDAMFAKHQKT